MLGSAAIMSTDAPTSLDRGAARLVAAAFLLLAFACAPAPQGSSPAGGSAAAAPRAAAAGSAVLFIGDGMGPAYVTVTRVARHGSAGHLHLDDLPYTAILRTHSSDGPVTDSAASATAMACGRKTVNWVLGEGPDAVYRRHDGTRLESIALEAARRGLRIGVVTTARVTHATPAAFYAVSDDRDRERDIARQAIAAPLDLLLGGGRRFFLPRPPKTERDGWLPSDGEDLEDAARARGWTVVTTLPGLRALRGGEEKILGLFDDDHLPYEARAPSMPPRAAPTLVEMIRFAIDRLRRDRTPFLLVVEGGRIDHAGHENWARTLVDETAAFDDAVGVALQRLDPATTLLLVTADHETGGLAMSGYPSEQEGIWGSYRDEQGVSHPILTFARGPGLSGAARAPYGKDDPRPSASHGPDGAHTGVDVPLYGWGHGADQVHGTLENTAVYELLRAQIEGRPAVPDPRPGS
jgi:alkaline phosphatase